MPRRLNYVTFMHRLLAVTWVWSVGEGLGFMWSTGIGHHKNSHRNRRSDWLVVKRRDCHYQVILEKRDHIFVSSVCQKTGLIQQLRLFSVKLKGITIIPTCIYLMEKIHVNLCFGLPGIIIWEFKKIWESLYAENHSHTWHRATMLLTKEIATTPVMFSWKITLVPLRKFFPIIKTSSPPFTEQLWRLFLRISGTPAGWAEE